MKCSGQKLYRIQFLTGTLAIVVLLWLGNFVDLCAQTSTEVEATEALRSLEITYVPEPNVSIPDVYTEPPKIIEQVINGKPEFQIFYFCRYHTSDELKQIIQEQFASAIFDQKGKETKVPDYAVSSNPAANQLIVRCPLREDADAIFETLNLIDVPPVQVKIDCLISEIYADFTFDREVTIAIEELFGEDIALKPSGTAFGADVRQLIEDDEYLPAFPGASLRELFRARMGLNIGYMGTDNFTILIDLLESKGFLKILMNPTIETINGKTAIVKSTQNIPLQQVTKTIPGAGNTTVVQTETEYVDIIDSLEITPHVFADGYIGLETNIVLGLGNTPLGVKQVPIVTIKEIENKENRIRQGESLIIGGIRKTERFGVIRGIPILKDIPLIGFLFSGEDTEERAVETVFILTPTISTGGVPKKEMFENVMEKHEPPSPASLGNAITDPFGSNAREREQRRKTEEAERIRLEAEVEKAEARIAVRQASERAERAEEELNRIRSEAERIKANAQKTMIEAEAKAKAAEQIKAEAERAKAEANAKVRAAEKANDEESSDEAEISATEKTQLEATKNPEKPQEESEGANIQNDKAESEV